MWTSVLVLAIAVNLEPTRIGLLPLLLSRRQPLLQLLAYLVGSLTISLGFGLAVLFVFDESVFGTSASGGGKAQIAVGVLALLVAAVMAVRGLRTRRGSGVPSTVPADAAGTDSRTGRPAPSTSSPSRSAGSWAKGARPGSPAW
ncbi:MAG: GAP family protein [Mycobacterium sp.]